MNEPLSYRSRFRFRLEKNLNIKEKEHHINIDGYDITVSSQLPDDDISDSEWVVMNTRGFSHQKEAENFSEKLKLACELASVSMRLGLDSGKNLATSGFFKSVKNRLKEESGIILRNNVHGIDVFSDDPNVRIAHLKATGIVRASGDIFLKDLSTFYNEVEEASNTTKDIVLLLNYALMRPDPVAKIVFAFSAVEMLGQDESWSPDQIQLIDAVSKLVDKQNIGTKKEKEEVKDSIGKGLHKLSLRQGVLRLLSKLNLEHLKKEWDRLYSERSTLVHGLAPRPGVDYNSFADKSISLCGHILLTAISEDIPSVKKQIELFYPVNMA